MAKLTGQTIADSYDQLLIVDNASGVSASLQAIEAGDTGGSASSLKISTSKCEVIPASNSTSLFEVSQADGTAVLSVDTTNARVGIGTASPGQDLAVENNQDAATAISVTNPSTGASADCRYSWYNSANNINAIFYSTGHSLANKLIFTDSATSDICFDISGKVGIGTAAPAELLTIGSVTNGATINMLMTAKDDSGAEQKRYFTLDPDTDRLYIGSAASSSSFVMDSAGNVGIGTAAPEKKLHIAHDSSTTEYPLMVENPNQTAGARTGILFEVYDQEASIEVERDENNVGVDMRFLLADSSDGTKQERLTILESGNVGIGDAAPPSNLHIKTASGGTTLGFQCATNATDYDIDYYLNSSDDIYSRIRWNEGSTDWSFQTNVTGGLTTPMIVNYNGTGNVGIGMSPDTVFNVKGAASSGIRLYKSDGSTVIAKLEGDGSEDGDLTLNNSSGTTNIYLSGQDSGASYIKTGDFTIGGTSGGYKLNCIDSHETDFVARIYADHTGSATKILELTNKHGGDPTTGNKYITFADLDGTLDSIEGDGAGGIRFTGEAEDTYSDSRIKTDIADLGSALSKINALKPRTFNYSDEFLNQNFQTHTIKEWQKKTQVGFIAQEIGSVFPDIVQTTPHMVQNDNISYDGEIYNTNDWVDIQEVAWGRKGNAHFLAYLVKAIQELSAKVEALENA